MKRRLVLLLSLMILAQPAFADFKEHFDLGTKYLSNYQFESAISEFKNALKINYKDNSARIQIINAYSASGMHYANSEKNWNKAADAYRSALFYLELYPEKQITNSASISSFQNNLNICLNMLKFDRSPKSRYEKAKALRADGNFAAAAYEFNQALGEASQIKDCYSQTGDIFNILGNPQRAADYYKKALTVDPSDTSLRLSYAKLMDKLGSEDIAVEEYNYILTKGSNNKELLNSLERIYKKKFEDNPNDADLCASLGAILQKQEKYDEAIQYYRKSEQMNPSNITTRINAGTLYQQKGDYKTAIIAYDSVLILDPNNVNANLYKAQCKAALGEDKAAAEIYKKVLAIDPTNTVARTEMLNAVKNNMNITAFIDYVNKNAVSSEDATKMLYDYALELHKENKYDDAITIYNNLLDKDKNGEIYMNLAIAENQQGKETEALNILKTAHEKFPDNTMVSKAIDEINANLRNRQLDKAAEAFNAKKYEEAIKEYLSIIPPSADTMLAVASAYQNMEDMTNALNYYKKAFELKPQDSEIAYYIASIYADKEDYPSAEAYAQKSLLLNKNNKNSKELLNSIYVAVRQKTLENAISLYEHEDYTNALPLLDKVIVEDKKNAYAYYYRAMVYDAQKKYAEAIADYKAAIKINPNDLKIINYLIAVDYDAQEKYKEAYDFYVKYSTSDVPEDEYKTYATDRAKELKDYVEQSTKPVAEKK